MNDDASVEITCSVTKSISLLAGQFGAYAKEYAHLLTPLPQGQRCGHAGDVLEGKRIKESFMKALRREASVLSDEQINQARCVALDLWRKADYCHLYDWVEIVHHVDEALDIAKNHPKVEESHLPRSDLNRPKPIGRIDCG